LLSAYLTAEIPNKSSRENVDNQNLFYLPFYERIEKKQSIMILLLLSLLAVDRLGIV